MMKTKDTENFLVADMFKRQMIVCGIATKIRSEVAFTADAATLTTLLFMQCPVRIVGSQYFALGEHMNISMNVQIT